MNFNLQGSKLVRETANTYSLINQVKDTFNNFGLFSPDNEKHPINLSRNNSTKPSSSDDNSDSNKEPQSNDDNQICSVNTIKQLG